MIAQTYVRFPQPVTLDLRIATGPRPRVIPATDDATQPAPEPHEFTEMPLHLHMDGQARTISAYLPPIPGRLELYGPADFAAACPDTPEDFAQRVLQILGSDPAATLQALIDGIQPPRPPRIPREIPNWRAKAILATMGLTANVEAIIGALPEPQRTVVTAAWAGDAKLARHGATVLALGTALGMSAADIDQLFIAAESIEI